MFIDRVKIKVRAGKGGNGMASFRREKYVPLGGPYGGDGGDGGSILFEVDSNKSTLLDLRFNKLLLAADGVNGKNKKMGGARGESLIVKVPAGTIVRDLATDAIIADLIRPGQQAIVAAGGKGGRGNWHFATPRNPAPDFFEHGSPGEEREILVELKLLADVGLIGFPSVGKSTFLSVVSAARPEIAAYPFTTIVPNLGVVQVRDGRSFVLADLPGLIEGASQGKGLGTQFLRHIERCRVLIHIIDMGAEDHRDPVEDYRVINTELGLYQMRLLERPQVVVANKMDLPDAQENLKRFKEAFPEIEVFEAITLIREGLDEVLFRAVQLLENTPEFILEELKEDGVHYKFIPEEEPFTVTRVAEHTWRLTGKRIERLYTMADLKSDTTIARFSRAVRHMGVDEALRKAGAVDGDVIQLVDTEFLFVD